MVSWAEFAAADPELAEFGHARIHKYGDGIGFLATRRSHDGGPRVHPVCVISGEGRLFVSIPRRSPKNADLRRDGRYMLHAFPDKEDPEFSIRGTARLATGADRQLAADSAVFATGVRDDEDVFELDIERADGTTWMNWAQADTYAVRRKWLASRP